MLVYYLFQTGLSIFDMNVNKGCMKVHKGFVLGHLSRI